MQKTLVQLGVAPLLLTVKQAADYLGVSTRHFAKLAKGLPRADMREAGAEHPVWRYRRMDLDAIADSRVVEVGQSASPPKGFTKLPPPTRRPEPIPKKNLALASRKRKLQLTSARARLSLVPSNA